MSGVLIKKVINPTKEILDLTTDWMFHWWGIEENYSYHDVYTYMTHSFNDEQLPQTYLMYLDNKIIGMYQITYRDLFVRPDIYPWIANLYIDQKFRNNGYGKILIESIKEQALNHTHFDKLFLYSNHNMLYERFGWKYIEFIPNNESKLYELDLTKSILE